MNIKLMHQTQEALDYDIHYKHGLDMETTYEDRIEALTMEISELFNDLNYFKYWKEDQSPKSSALEEAADILHFALSLANDEHIIFERVSTDLGLDEPYNIVFRSMHQLTFNLFQDDVQERCATLEAIFNLTFNLANRIGYTDAQLYEAYFNKVSENERRQEEGY